MTSRTLLVLVGSLAFLVLAGFNCDERSRQLPSAPKPDPIGRFQLFQGTVAVSYTNSTENVPTVFRIDTVTGEVSYFVRGVGNDGKLDSFWSVPEK
jgi:hypothetical protein